MQKIDTPLLTALPQPSMRGVHSWHAYNTLIHSFRFLNIPCSDSSTARTDLGLQTHASDLDCCHIIWSTRLLWSQHLTCNHQISHVHFNSTSLKSKNHLEFGPLLCQKVVGTEMKLIKGKERMNPKHMWPQSHNPCQTRVTPLPQTWRSLYHPCVQHCCNKYKRGIVVAIIMRSTKHNTVWKPLMKPCFRPRHNWRD